MDRLVLLSVLLIASVLLFPSIAFSASQQDIVSSINNRIDPDLSDAAVNQMGYIVNGSWNQIDEWALSYKDNSTELNSLVISVFGNHSWIPVVVNGTVVNSTQVPPPPTKVEICGDGIDNDGDGQVDEGCPIKPPEPSGKPDTNVNSSKTVRVVALGDIDINSGLDKQLALAKKYNADILIIVGDYGYKDCQKAIDVLSKAGWDKTNSAIDQGNHDCSSSTKAYNGLSQLYGYVDTLNPQVDFMLIDANQGFGNGTSQYNSLKSGLSSSDAMYKIPVTHQPFVTVDSTHHDNGKFKDYQPLFRGEGVKLVLGAHNHNYQRFNIQGIIYLDVGVGTHDTGSSMYPLKSNDWNGFNCIKCITGTNGIVILDFQIDNPHINSMQGWFIDMNENVKDKFAW